MKTGPLLVLNIALIAVALFVYDQMRATPAPAASGPGLDVGLRADDLHDAPPPRRLDDEPMLSGGQVDIEMLRGLQSEIDSLRSELSRFKQSARNAAAGGGAAAAARNPGEPMPTMDLDVGDAESPVFEERSLASFEAYLDEVNRRRAIQRQRDRVEGQLERLELGLTPDEHKAVVDATVAYQAESAELFRAGWPKDEGGRAQRREAFETLQNSYASKIGGLVSADAAKKITESRIGRARGFVSGGQSNRQGRGDR